MARGARGFGGGFGRREVYPSTVGAKVFAIDFFTFSSSFCGSSVSPMRAHKVKVKMGIFTIPSKVYQFLSFSPTFAHVILMFLSSGNQEQVCWTKPRNYSNRAIHPSSPSYKHRFNHLHTKPSLGRSCIPHFYTGENSNRSSPHFKT